MCFWLLLAPIFYALTDPRESTPRADGAPAVQHVHFPPFSRTWETVKTCVHIAAVLTSIPGVGISAYLMSAYYQDPSRISIVGLVGLPVLLLTFLWNALELILRAKRQWKTGSRPATHVATGLIISIITVWIGSSLARGTTRTSCRHFDFSVYDTCLDHSDPFSPHIDPNMPPCVTAFVLINAAFHLFIFLAGCVDLHRRNKENRRLDAAADAAAASRPQAGGAAMETVQNGVTLAAPSLQVPMAAASVHSLRESYATPHAERSAV
ncbi:hypothetical protein ESCO_002061 [Escovopsis weberi]|uniref:MARVEL domain-containing protein n=1 Tax=Escovopsis weberi TaxID=150374 RepID=A0A0M8MZG1_ESCWE|nr:hypothetical protein ESCO_002061 [Escovopsis weberi]